jgi:Uma2 family endonuclease
VTIAERYQETIPVPRAIRLPVELIPPEGFDLEDPRTWPKVEGRLEYVNGRLLFTPPCGELQSYTVADVVAALLPWVRAHGEFVLGTNEAGMLLQGDARGVDAGIWRRDTEGPPQAKFHRRPPVLAVEVPVRMKRMRVCAKKPRGISARASRLSGSFCPSNARSS